MKAGKKVALSLATLAAVASVALTAAPASAAGDTGRYKGCAAHWRNTAAWNECQSSPGVDLQLQVHCENAFGGSGSWWQGIWRRVSGTMDPVDRFECAFKTRQALNAYRN